MQPNEISEGTPGDEVDSTGSSCGDNPKSNKPLMEKRRRARINKSLNELKTMLLQALKGNSCGHSKLEKADILEMTVRYVTKLEQHKARTTRIDPGVLNKYKAGFSECRNEVMKFLSTHEGVSVEVRTRLLDHLKNCQQTLQDPENFVDDDFIGIGAEACWRHSPTESEDNTMQQSPSVTHERESERRLSLEYRCSQQSDVPLEVTSEDLSHVGGQIQIISAETLSSSSACSYTESPYKAVAITSPAMGEQNAFARPVATTSEDTMCRTCTNGVAVPSANDPHFLMRTSSKHHAMAGLGGFKEQPYAALLAPSAQDQSYAGRYFFVPREERNCQEAAGSGAIDPKLRTIDYRQPQTSFVNTYPTIQKSNMQNNHERKNHAQVSKEPWRPW